MTLRMFYLTLTWAAAGAAVLSGALSIYYWMRDRRQREWKRRLAEVKRDYAALELEMATRGYYRGRVVEMPARGGKGRA